jgi:hypothetical protein
MFNMAVIILVLHLNITNLGSGCQISAHVQQDLHDALMSVEGGGDERSGAHLWAALEEDM